MPARHPNRSASMSPSLPHVVAFDAATLTDLGIELVLPPVMVLGIVAFLSEKARRRLATRGGLTAATLLAFGPAATYVGYRLAALTG